MDIDYHYYVIKTLAYTAGFSEEDAQTIAYYSQQVDDFVKCSPMRVRQEPPAFFVEKGYAKKSMGGTWQVMPHPTGIDILQSVRDQYQHTTLASFHFLPARPLSEIESESGFTRADYRCVRADDKRAVLIDQIIEEAVEAVRQEKCEKSLMQLGMALHTYADTYAHCGYSGLEGWENRAVIKGALNQQTGKEEVPAYERFAYREVPHIGHGNSGHVPDICTYRIDVAMQKDEQDHAYTQHIVRDNLEDFLACAKAILEYLGKAAQTDVFDEIVWDEFKEELARAMQVPTSDEARKDKLTAHWKTVFPEIVYQYDKHERFYRTENGIQMTDTSFLDEAAEVMPFGAGMSEISEEMTQVSDMAEDAIASIRIYDVTDAFYMYNELSYLRAEMVLGTDEMLIRHAQTLTEEQPLLFMANKTTYDDVWKPQTELALAVYTAGFEYHPDKDIMCSTMNNVQRMGGYCRLYDDTAYVISSIIDSEPICFHYDGYEWMIELWKGQYGIETGCEIGIYYREQDKPLSIAEKTLMGKLYTCVPDERMLDLRFSLRKGDEELFARDWKKHWWLTGFHWGVLSEPEQLEMTVGIRFPNREMQQAFVHEGMEAIGYSYTETNDCCVEFCFTKPLTKQPAARDKMRPVVQPANQTLVNTYNKVRTKYGITTNDPNVIGQVLMGHAGSAEKSLYESMIRYYNMKAKHKSKAQEQV